MTAGAEPIEGRGDSSRAESEERGAFDRLAEAVGPEFARRLVDALVGQRAASPPA